MKRYVAAAVSGLVLLASCATMQPKPPDFSGGHTKIIEGYRMSFGTKITMSTIAGIYAGTVHGRCDGDECSARGTYSRLQHPEAMQKALQSADVNRDKIITDQEAEDLFFKLLKKGR